MKIFGSGLQRTGTMSLTRALNQLNLPAKQFPKELHQDIHHPIINEYVAFTDFPIPLLYRELDKAYPGSKFIHTIRDEAAWLKSVEWLFTTGAVKFNLENNFYAQTFHQEFYGINHFDEAVFLRRYREHNAKAASYFAGRPDDFLMIDLTAGEGYEKICPFLGIPIPETPFPRSNKSQDLSKVQSKKIKRHSRNQIRSVLERSRLLPLLQIARGVLSPIPLTNAPERLSCRPFFIISSDRSGSTLLRETLNGHSAISIPPESHKLGHIVNRFQKSYRFQPWNQLPALVAAEFQQEPDFAYWDMDLAGFFKQVSRLNKPDQNLAKLIDNFYIHYRQTHEPTALRWGDMSLETVDTLPAIDALFPTAQFIHIVRDGRDVAASLVEQGFFPNPMSAAQHWLEKVRLAKEFGQKIRNGRFLEIKYEELVQDPETAVQSVCNFLALDYQPEMLEFWRHAQKLDDSDHPQHQNLIIPIDTETVGKWQRQFSTNELAQVNNHLSKMLIELGYPL